MKHTILISDKFDSDGVQKLRSQSNFEVIYKTGHKREELLEDIGQAHGLIIRSATKVDDEVLNKASNLKLIVRAGVGVDNINIPEASKRGIIVMNAPGGNSVSTSEQAIALLTSLSRNIPQATASMKEGKWEKSKFKGTELTGKTIGVVGLGRIGREVVKRAKGLQMEVIGYDPYIPAESLTHLEIDIVSKEEIIERSDFITVHTPLTDSTRDFVNSSNLADLKDGVRLINCARGGIYNEAALEEGLKSGKIAGIALDVFTTEPVPSDFPLLSYPNAIFSPHLGASTSEAEFAVAMETVDELIEFFEKGIARNALNFPTMDPETLDYLKPYYEGGEKAGTLLAHACGGDVRTIEIEYSGYITRYKTDPVTTAIIKGALTPAMGKDDLNYVNAPFFAKDRGIRIINEKVDRQDGYRSSITVTVEAGTGKKSKIKYTSIHKEPYVVSMDGLAIEFKPDGVILLLENNDVPKVVGAVGSFLGDLNINIASIELARSARGEKARSIITIDEPLTADQLDKLSRLEQIISAVQVDLRSDGQDR